jgi:hypothetical protein
MVDLPAPVHYEICLDGPSYFSGEMESFSIHKNSLTGRSYIAVKGNEYIYMMTFDNDEIFEDESSYLNEKLKESLDIAYEKALDDETYD